MLYRVNFDFLKSIPEGYPSLKIRSRDGWQADKTGLIFLRETRGKTRQSIWLNGVKLICCPDEPDTDAIAATFTIEEFKATIPKCISAAPKQLFYPVPNRLKRNLWLLLTVTPLDTFQGQDNA